MVAAFGETTAGSVLLGLRDHMLSCAEGRCILKGRPRISTSTVDLNALARLPENTFGYAYVSWLERCGVTPDTRDPVCLLLHAPVCSCILMEFSCATSIIQSL